jgi:hypothetical protein
VDLSGSLGGVGQGYFRQEGLISNATSVANYAVEIASILLAHDLSVEIITFGYKPYSIKPAQKNKPQEIYDLIYQSQAMVDPGGNDLLFAFREVTKKIDFNLESTQNLVITMTDGGIRSEYISSYNPEYPKLKNYSDYKDEFAKLINKLESVSKFLGVSIRDQHITEFFSESALVHNQSDCLKAILMFLIKNIKRG